MNTDEHAGRAAVEAGAQKVAAAAPNPPSYVLCTGRVSVVIRRLIHHSWAGTNWKGSAGQGPAISHKTGTRPTGFSYVLSISSLPK
jgi:hypothetical protein